MFPIVKNAYFIIKKSFKIILKWLRIKKFEKFNFEKKEKWIWTQYAFPSISYHFRIPIIFDYLEFHCPTEVLAVGTIFFPGEQFFFPTASPYQTFLGTLNLFIPLTNLKRSSLSGGLNPRPSDQKSDPLKDELLMLGWKEQILFDYLYAILIIINRWNVWGLARNGHGHGRAVDYMSFHFPWLVGPFEVCSWIRGSINVRGCPAALNQDQRNWWTERANSNRSFKTKGQIMPINYYTPPPLDFQKDCPHAPVVPTALYVAKKRVRGTIFDLNLQKILVSLTKLG